MSTCGRWAWLTSFALLMACGGDPRVEPDADGEVDTRVEEVDSSTPDTGPETVDDTVEDTRTPDTAETSPDTADTSDTDDTPDTNDTPDTPDTNDTSDTEDTDDTSDADDTADTADTTDTSDTSDTAPDTNDTSDTNDTGDATDGTDTTPELCPAGACDDGDPCSADRCDPETGVCTYTHDDGASCDDGDDCTVEDTCFEGLCEPGPPRDCSDDNACTVDGCRLGSVGEAICFHRARSCDDGEPCTSDSCSPTTGCLFTPRAGPCQDGDACTVSDQCQGGVCVSGPAAVCDDGIACTNDRCDPALGCVYQATAGCSCGDGTLQGGEQCDDGNTITGDGCSAGCRVERCGDGVLQVTLGEQCDDGNRRNGDGCDGACVRERCGDGVLQEGLGEDCDDGNTDASDGCGPGCAFEGCGDGFLQVALGEQCDDGNPALDDGCTPSCRLERCGDGVIQAAREQCDDGNTRSQDGCSSGCVVESCGDGLVQPGRGEQCDDGDTEPDDGCGPSCRVEFCGDGVTQASAEECDDGNTALDDGCGPTCRVERCGDGHLQSGETCDDGGELSGDGCSATCGFEPCAKLTFVLDANYGGIAAGWQVRDPAGRIVFEVPTNTQISQRFTTFIAQIPEGNYLLHKRSHNNNGWLGSTLRITRPDGVEIFAGTHPAGPEVVVPLRFDCVSFCGDNIVDTTRGETCDDANTDDEDACRNSCRITGCGDGTLDTNEGCDDGNVEGGDTCSAACAFEPCAARTVRVTNLSAEWVFSLWRIKDSAGAVVARAWDGLGAPPMVAPNGSLDVVVQVKAGVYTFEPLNNSQQLVTWDDRRYTLSDPDGTARAIGQGPSAFSLGCAPFCGDRLVQADRGEQCDDGNRTQDDGCGNTCKVEGCGDGIVQTTRGEACDDGNTADGDTCRGDCSRLNCAPWRLEVEVPQTSPTLVASTAWEIRTPEGYLVASGNPGVEGAGGTQRTFLHLPPGQLTMTASISSNVVGLIATMYRPDGSRAFGFTTLGATSRTVPFTATCTPAPCGDNVVGAGEACDDGGLAANDGCGPTCQLETCGDGQLRAGEACDDANTATGDGCSSTCSFEPCTRHTVRVKRTGQFLFFPRWRIVDTANRVVASGEAPIIDPNGSFDTTVSLLPGAYTFETRVMDGNVYGPGVWESAEYTVLGPSGAVLATGLSAKPFSASCPRFCGDGVTQDGEQCDDGGTRAGDGCGPDCKVERCGDGLLHAGERCDDGGEVGGDGCSGTCAFEPCASHRVEVTTGLNGYMVRWRIVDAAGRVVGSVDGHPSWSTSTHTVELPAGDYTYVAVPWFQQLGYAVVRVLAPDDTVVRTFTVEPGRPFDTRFGFSTACVPFCGDGVAQLERDEECDDGGRATGDGCGATCLVEACGDGTVQAELGEGCDDGDRESGDGCDADCQPEGCGDGKIQVGLGESCEDGNTRANDGCANCRLEVCGDGIVQRGRGEVCDDGDTTAGGSCSADCGAVQCAPFDVRFFFPERPEQVGFRIVDTLGVVAARLEPGALPPFPRDITRELTLAPGSYTFTALGANAASFNGGTFILTNDAGVTLTSGAVPAGTSEVSRTFTLGCVAPWCGDGVVQPGEACDDGDREDGDGCSRTCETERCGDGLVQRGRGESCDDRGVVSGDGCSAECQATCRPITVEVETLYGGQRVGWALRDESGAIIASAAPGTYASRGSSATPLTVTTGTYHFEVTPVVDAAGTVRVQVAPNNFGYWESLTATARPPQAVNVTCDAHWCGDGVTDTDEGESCDDGNGSSGDGCTPACVAEVCGDGVLHPALGEACDDGDLDAGDGCGPTCQIERCGDGVDQPGEGCDDGNLVDGDGCDGECVLEVCGNGKAQFGEECDDGDLDFDDGCDGECVAEVCGDGLVQAGIGETCDDGNTSAGDGCDARCLAEVCGNGRIQANERCDDGNQVDGDGCSSGCVGEPCARHVVRITSPSAGSGIVWSLTRDDGVVVAGFGPGAYLAGVTRHELVLPPDSYELRLTDVGAGWGGASIEVRGPTGVALVNTTKTTPYGVTQVLPLELACLAFCGDGKVMAGEACDDGGTSSGDGCDAGCVIERCGDGIVQAALGERCDDGGVEAGDGCSPTCTVEGCGNGNLDAGEQCDDGDADGNDGCGPTCQTERCGDGITQRLRGEVCDDGDEVMGGGCDATCESFPCARHIVSVTASPYADPTELNWTIRDRLGAVVASRARGSFGPGTTAVEVQLPAEDYTFEIAGPASISFAVRDVVGTERLAMGVGVASGGTFVRSFSTSCITAWCGDGEVDAGEQCDDGNTSAGDGCDARCVAEICGDGIIQRALGERCDTGPEVATNLGDGCSPSCQIECQPLSLEVGTLGHNRLGWRVRAQTGEILEAGAPSFGAGNRVVAAPRVLAGDYELQVFPDPYPGYWRGTVALVDVAGLRLVDEAIVSGSTFHSVPFTAECVTEWCGDGVVQAGESCDDGARVAGDGCSPTCQTERCGDGILQAGRGEECDDGGETAFDGCSATCRLERCGDGVLHEIQGEQCDDGDLEAGDGCDANCRVESCGDGFVSAGLLETCDDGGTAAGDGCSATCTYETPCTDYEIHVRHSAFMPAWRLEGPSTPDGGNGPLVASDLDETGLASVIPVKLLPGRYTFTPYRDGQPMGAFDNFSLELVHAPSGTVVDRIAFHANAPPPTALTAACITRWCGDGVQGGDEGCDDGNNTANDGCSPACAPEICGDRVVSGPRGETCDDGAAVSGDGCSATCTFEPCADHVLHFTTGQSAWMVGWDLLDAAGTTVASGAYDSLASLASVNIPLKLVAGRHRFVMRSEAPALGWNGAVFTLRDRTGEVLASGTLAAGTARSELAFETGCIERWCGDGARQEDLGEACDDGNRASEDGCSAGCLVERCGDGVVQPGLGETCDDGGLANNDGCSAGCLVERCGDGAVQSVLEETCDDGNTQPGDGCSALCRAEGCGDGIVQAGLGEACDDGNTASADGCSAGCAFEACSRWQVEITAVGGGRGYWEVNRDGVKIGGLEALTTLPPTATTELTLLPGAYELRVSGAFDGGVQGQIGYRVIDHTGLVLVSGQIPWGGARRVAFTTACVTEWCGDGIVQAARGEVCDDGDRESEDGCSAQCRIERCGDGVVQAGLGESCDDGNTASGDGCSASCQTERCGDGVVQASRGETCDDGDTDSDDGCSASCLVERCGDQVVQASRAETCDDGNTASDDGCSAGCQTERCGDGVVQGPRGETCDDGDTDSGDGCSATCKVERCGDGLLQSGEGCDDGNTVSEDGCSSGCVAERCGDGIVQTGLREGCDVGDAVDGDGCDSNCVPEVCGNGKLQANEGCDDGNTFNGDGCDGQCVAEVCGNGKRQATETCDDGNTAPGDGCDGQCVAEACGNGKRQSGEACDDGNTVGGDGCDASCRVEACGNGLVQPPETCDDGNTLTGDGCDGQCVAEVCGNGKRQTGEGCDDGNTIHGDGCSATCVKEACAPTRFATTTLFAGHNVRWFLYDAGGPTGQALAVGSGFGSNTARVDLRDVNAGPGTLVLTTADGSASGWGGAELVITTHAGQELFRGTLPNGQSTRTVPLTLTCISAWCGDALVQAAAGEQCDDSRNLAGDGCDAECQREFCGDTRIQPGLGEQCDDGDTEGGDGCDSLCRLEVCGNGLTQAPEGCDDGNTRTGDGCDAECVSEVCGNNKRQMNEQCDDGNRTPGDGCDASCRTEVCGNGILQVPPEGCDDGNRNNGDRCDADCVLELCGNGKVQSGEGCDDGNTVSGDGCDSGCRREVCGNGLRQGAEQCDDGNTVDSDGCDSSCRREVCGNGAVQVGETCDDGNATDGDGCDRSCRSEVCGNGFLQPGAGEQCDDGNVVSGDGCSAVCLVERCGDGVRQSARGEQCDDGNTNNGDGCDGGCRSEVCGNQLVQAGEGCDDGNTLNSDGCDAQCVRELCGNGKVQSGELCDAGPNNSPTLPDTCRPDCRPARCGDGVRDTGEACDAGADNSDTLSGRCRSTCVLPRCGDTVVDPGEGCDDGNATTGDGCSPTCRVEGCGDGVRQAGEDCDDSNTNSGDGCDAGCRTEVCGNGVLQVGEGCDDGGRVPGDGCDADCVVERCGNGKTQASETCDDGNTAANDGCSATCRVEVCGDGVLQPPREACEDGNGENGDGCSAACGVEACARFTVRLVTRDLGSVSGWSLRRVGGAAGQGTELVASAPLFSLGNGQTTTTPVVLTAGDYVVEGSVVSWASGRGWDGGSLEVLDPAGGVVARITVPAGSTSVSAAFAARCGARCGDGVVHASLGETCDLGDTTPGDGCDASCRVEACAEHRLFVDDILYGRGWSLAKLVNGVPGAPLLTSPSYSPGAREEALVLFDGAYRFSMSSTSNAGWDGRTFRIVDAFGGVLASGGLGANQRTGAVDFTVACGDAGCGDGVVQPALGENCDDGNTTGGDGCDAGCGLEGCGDGVTQVGLGESCDDGNTEDGDGCDALCRTEVCGNGILQGDEACDDGNAVSGDGCSAACLWERCADFTLELERPTGAGVGYRVTANAGLLPGVAVDFPLTLMPAGSNTVPLKLHAGSWRFTARAYASWPGWAGGSWRVRAPSGAVVASGTPSAPGESSVTFAMTCVAFCGDGVVGAGEQCDDGNSLNSDGCSSTCQTERCGDRLVQAGRGEQCDDGNTATGDGCASCAFESCASHRVRVRTGERAHTIGWTLRDGAGQVVASAPLGSLQTWNTDTDTALQLLPGNYTFEALASDEYGGGWQGATFEVRALHANAVRASGTLTSGTRSVVAFSVECLQPSCGDAVIQPLAGEQCDDGARTAGDGCSATCQHEPCAAHTVELVVGARYPGYRITNGLGQVVVETAPQSFTPQNPPRLFTQSVMLPAGAYQVTLLEAFGNGWGLGSLRLVARSGEVIAQGTLASGASTTLNTTARCITEWCGDGVRQASLGELCDDGNRTAGDGCDTSCRVERCGDGIVQPALNEQCDDGNLVDSDACPTTCRNARCGDGFVRPGVEACDDGNEVQTDTCTNTCALPRCGDGHHQPLAGELCDDGDTDDTDACTSRCRLPACGDGAVQSGEACDDGNLAAADGCAQSCTFEGCAAHTLRFHAGYDRWRAGWRVLDGQGRVWAELAPGAIKDFTVRDIAVNLPDGAYVLRTLNLAGAPGAWADYPQPELAHATTWVSVIDHEGGVLRRAVHASGTSNDWAFTVACVNRCGDGVVHSARGEACDDGNAISDDGCGPSCQTERCGDGVLQALRGETCDDGNAVDGDGCNARCVAEGCGDGLVQSQLGEQCDDGNRVAEDGCGPSCQTERCGDGIAQTRRGEQCDLGLANANTADTCRPDCRAPACGDGIVDSGEACDWADLNSNTQPGACRLGCVAPRCGDAIKDPNEGCDDGDLESGDGCSAACAIECPGPLCRPEVCVDTADPGCTEIRCGNGVRQAGEACDDGNRAPGDGCDPGCRVERCGDGVVQSGEQCDDGNAALGDGCTPGCQLEGVCRRFTLRWWSNPAYWPVEVFRVRTADGTVIATNEGLGWDRQSGVGEPIALELTAGTTYTFAPRFGGTSYGLRFELEHVASGTIVAQGGWNLFQAQAPIPFTARCVTEWCGDGRTQATLGESCDDGARLSGDGCSDGCRLEGCGDGTFQPLLGEQCDDGNRVADDGCDAECRFDSPCSEHRLTILRGTDHNDGLTWQLTAPDGTVIATDAAVTAVDARTRVVAVKLLPGVRYTLSPTGANRFVPTWNDLTAVLVHAPSGATVAQGSLGSGMTGGKSIALSFSECILHWCGDGTRDTGEGCDDGGRVSGDGCSASCVEEFCGDGVVQPGLGEQCDDGAPAAADACTASCQWDRCADFEVSWTTATAPAVVRSATSWEVVDQSGAVVASGAGATSFRTGPDALKLVPGAYTLRLPPQARTNLPHVYRVASAGNEQVMGSLFVDGWGAYNLPFMASCVAPTCGDGVVQAAAGERCDDGNRVSFDGCSAMCQVERCGDGVLHTAAGEVCDDGNTVSGDSCAGDCRSTLCGRWHLRFERWSRGGFVEIRDGRGALVRAFYGGAFEPEVFHDVYLDLGPGPYAVTEFSQPFTLRNGLGELVAQSNVVNGQTVRVNENPWDGRFYFTAGCTESCGDRAVQSGEGCDDGNTLVNDGCSPGCVSEGWRCGDGVAQPTIGEQCDDGNTSAGDGCGATCLREYCGDGVAQATLGEQCDDGDNDDNDRCTNGCQVNLCGDGLLQAGEECDWGLARDASGCTRKCKWAPCTRFSFFTRYHDLVSLVSAIPGIGTAASVALAIVTVGLQQSLVWEIRDETRGTMVNLHAPTFMTSELSPVTRWPGYGATLPASAGGGSIDAYASTLGYVLSVLLEKVTKFDFSPPVYTYEHPQIVLPPGRFTLRRLVTVPGPWLVTTQWVANRNGGNSRIEVAGFGDGIVPGWHETTFETTCQFMCGDGILQSQFGEQCDDGNLASGDGCSADCTWEWLARRSVPGGAFIRGTPDNERGRNADESRHPVQVGNFEIGIFEIKRGEWKHYMNGSDPTGVNAYVAPPCDTQCAARGVWWHEAATFANRVSAERGLEQCYTCGGGTCVPNQAPRDCTGFRLPTEAEWEYAARGMGVESGPGAVGAPNRLGLYNMLGGTPEWVHDRYEPYTGVVGNTFPSLLVNPAGPGAGTTRVSRGGGFDMTIRSNVEEALEARFGARRPRDPTPATTIEGWKVGIGFRLARTLP